jgi:DNA polymerase-3 subunit gamma/tau
MIKAEDVAAMLGLVDTELLFQFADIVGSNDTGGGLRFINDIVESGWDIRQFVKDAAEHFRNLFIAAYADDPDTIINATGEELAGIKKQAAGFSRSRLAEAIESLSGLNNSLRYASDPRLLLELELVKMTAAEGSREQRAESREQSVLSKEQATGNRQQATETKEQAVAEKPVVARKSDSDDAANSSQNVEIASSAKVQPPRKDIADKPIIATETNAIDTIKRVWPAVLTKVKNEKMSTYANLLECRPVSVEGAKVTLEFHDRASVHKKMIQSETAKTFIEGVLRDMTGKPYTILCVEGGRREDAIGESAAREVASSAKDQPPRNERTSRSKDSASENASTKSDANTENQEPESDEVASAAQAPGRDVPSLRGGADRSLANSSGQAPQPPKGETGSNNASGTADASEPKDMMATLTGLFDATVVETKERKDEG